MPGPWGFQAHPRRRQDGASGTPASPAASCNQRQWQWSAGLAAPAGPAGLANQTTSERDRATRLSAPPVVHVVPCWVADQHGASPGPRVGPDAPCGSRHVDQNQGQERGVGCPATGHRRAGHPLERLMVRRPLKRLPAPQGPADPAAGSGSVSLAGQTLTRPTDRWDGRVTAGTARRIARRPGPPGRGRRCWQVDVPYRIPTPSVHGLPGVTRVSGKPPKGAHQDTVYRTGQCA